jgi:uncharacterized repeat protein (TIGR03803 family)
VKRNVNAADKLNWARRACAFLVLLAGAAMGLPAQTFKTIFTFNGTEPGGPTAALVQATNGDLYGGTGDTVFKITPSGTLTTLYTFCTQTVYPYCPDGEGPVWRLVQATNGNFYGTTQIGGAYAGSYGYGAGSVFKMTPAGTPTTLYSFCALLGCADGEFPYAGLVQASDGNFYGTTWGGGATYSGTVFKITPGGELTTLHSCCSQSGCADGSYPYAGLVQGTDGDFYGTTSGGGAYGHGDGGGTVFKITSNGTLTTLYSFCAQSGCPDGDYPIAGLVQATNGDFYGTTKYGGAYEDGTVFKITPGGALTTLYSFCSRTGCPDGEYPHAGLLQATDGNLYGTTVFGGANDHGAVFKITPTGTLTTLYSFCAQGRYPACPDGENPDAGLVQATNGDIYGTTPDGGDCGNCGGTVFGLSVGLGPFVKTEPHSGKAGAAITILGTDLAGATSVSFNGTQAAFDVVMATEIKTTVPAGATTGKIQVTTPGGTLLSSGPFLVQP